MKILYPNVPYSDIPRLVKEGKIKVGTRVKACTDMEKYPSENALVIKSPRTIRKIENDALFFFERESPSWDFSSHYFLDILEDEAEELPPAKPLDFQAIEENAKKIDHLFKPKEGVCEDCHHIYSVWSTDTELWNKVVENEVHFLCLECFAQRAKKKGMEPMRWTLSAEYTPKPLSFSEPLTKEAVGKIVQIQVSEHPYLGYRIFGLGDDGELYAFEDGTSISFGDCNPINTESSEPQWVKMIKR